MPVFIIGYGKWNRWLGPLDNWLWKHTHNTCHTQWNLFDWKWQDLSDKSWLSWICMECNMMTIKTTWYAITWMKWFLSQIFCITTPYLVSSELDKLWPQSYTKKKTVGYIILEFESFYWTHSEGLCEKPRWAAKPICVISSKHAWYGIGDRPYIWLKSPVPMVRCLLILSCIGICPDSVKLKVLPFWALLQERAPNWMAWLGDGALSTYGWIWGIGLIQRQLVTIKGNPVIQTSWLDCSLLVLVQTRC